jgi:hypothetical protein
MGRYQPDDVQDGEGPIDEIGLPDFVAALSRHKWLVGGTVLLSAVLGSAAGTLAPENYLYSVIIQSATPPVAESVARLEHKIVAAVIARHVGDGNDEERERLERQFAVRAVPLSDLIIIETRAPPAQGPERLALLDAIAGELITDDKPVSDGKRAVFEARLADNDGILAKLPVQEQLLSARAGLLDDRLKILQDDAAREDEIIDRLSRERTAAPPSPLDDRRAFARLLFDQELTNAKERRDSLQATALEVMEARKSTDAEAAAIRQSRENAEQQRQALVAQRDAVPVTHTFVAAIQSRHPVGLGAATDAMIGAVGGLILGFAEVVALAHRARRRWKRVSRGWGEKPVEAAPGS